MNRLTEPDVAKYVIERGLVAPEDVVEVRQLEGGYINAVFRVFIRSGVDLVLKQSYEASERTVLRADIQRATFEVAVMRALKEKLGSRSPTPEVLDSDADRHLVVMSAAPRDARLYDDDLRAGQIDPRVTDAIVNYLADLHGATTGDASLRERFADNPGFALRDQSIRSAGRSNPDLVARIDGALQRNRTEATALVDADVTPKNVLVHDHGITKLDFECTQWGTPSLDLGVLLAHYVLSVFMIGSPGVQMLAEVRRTYENYTAIRQQFSTEFLMTTVEYMALMMLGRTDGDLVFDYVKPHRETVRTLARSLLSENFLAFAEVHELLASCVLPLPTAGELDSNG